MLIKMACLSLIFVTKNLTKLAKRTWRKVKLFNVNSH